MSEPSVYLIYYPIRRENGQRVGGPAVIATNQSFAYAAFSSKTLAKAFLKRLGGKPNYQLISLPELGGAAHPELVQGIRFVVRFNSQDALENYFASRKTRQPFPYEKYLYEREMVPVNSAQTKEG